MKTKELIRRFGGYFVGKEDMYVRDDLHLSGKGAAVFSENTASIYGQWNQVATI